jgi:hypothetical protein
MSICIKKSIFFERIVPEGFGVENAVKATKLRLALEDAMERKDLRKAATMVKEYREMYDKVMDVVHDNKCKLVLKEQPQFEWTWALSKESFMSPCWLWEKLMIHACESNIYVELGMDCAANHQWKESNKHFHTAGRHITTILTTILPKWTWKENQSVSMCLSDFWESRISFIHGMKDVCTLQFAYSSTDGITNKNAIKLLKRAESNANVSLLTWASDSNSSLMNWVRISRAFVMAKSFAENEEYGKAIGLLKMWEGSLNELEKNNMNPAMQTLMGVLKKIQSEKADWISTNDHIHYQKIESSELTLCVNVEHNSHIKPL